MDRKVAVKLDEARVSPRVKIAGLWIAAMFFYLYADYKALFEPGFIAKVMAGDLGSGFVINQEFLLFSAMLMSLPPVLAVLTLFLPAKAARIVNIVLAAAHAALALSILAGPTVPWAYYLWYSALEIACHAAIIVLSAKWPKEASQAA